MPAAPPLSLCSRLLLLIVLIAVQIVTPGFATVCAVGEALAATGTAAEAAHPAAGDTDERGAGDIDDCCDCGACGDCCLHAPTALPSPPRLPSLVFAPLLPASRTPAVAPAAYPVAIRPPIAR